MSRPREFPCQIGASRIRDSDRVAAMAADTKNGARGGAGAVRSRAAPLTRAELERKALQQKAKGQPAMLVNLRIVMSATAVTITLLLVAFGGIGLLLLARSPQEPLVTKLDLSPPLVVPAKPEPPSQAEVKTVPVPTPVVEAPQTKAEETVAVPPAKNDEPPIVAAPKKEETIAAPQNPVPVPEPETTATIPPAPEVKPETARKNVVKQRAAPQRPRVVRRLPPPKKAEPQFTNPFSRLFDGR